MSLSIVKFVIAHLEIWNVHFGVRVREINSYISKIFREFPELLIPA